MRENRENNRPGRLRIVLYVVLGAFVCAGLAALAVFLFSVLPSQYRHIARETYAEPFRAAGVGDVVRFGAYEQDGDESNGSEPIEWIVLQAQDDKLLLLSRRVLDGVSFSTRVSSSTWDDSTLRTWLNGSFYDTAFGGAEKMLVTESDVQAHTNPLYAADPGADTTDRVFLLSIEEALALMPTEQDRQCKPTAYAQSRDVKSDGTYCVWWLRTPGFDNSVASRILADGRVNYCGYLVSDAMNGVRPCVWVKRAA